MASLTAKQLTELANDFLGMAQSVGDYRYLHFGKLTKAQNKQFSDLHWSLLNYADDLFTQSATLVMDDVENALAQIKTISQEMTVSYKQLTKVQKAIDIATAAVTLGAAIFSKNPLAIIDAADALINVWKESS
ncbi:hypothetical protein GA0116948_10699 [Chitinophaga costaii]|uniref:Uncharacterized protein n=1 Tax=Chitinophaga costaii TaxID=1335309 RepID=A0A1C4DTN7_9BACT|nr:hypothetical protein [Chitinophaga costaii]PUZ27782.1 hypothetical protein DCM91_06130 [Chitinophaga costaii]SCC34630.1 hypothetical protein GA0116948_10699 [Chitinophaga costaii]